MDYSAASGLLLALISPPCSFTSHSKCLSPQPRAFATPCGVERVEDLLGILDSGAAVVEFDPEPGWSLVYDRTFSHSLVWVSNMALESVVDDIQENLLDLMRSATTLAVFRPICRARLEYC